MGDSSDRALNTAHKDESTYTARRYFFHYLRNSASGMVNANYLVSFSAYFTVKLEFLRKVTSNVPPVEPVKRTV